MVLCTVIAVGCHKPDIPYPHVPDCQIVKLKGEILYNDAVIISYNNKGNPVSMIRTLVGTGAPNFYFRYDKKHRITDYIGVYSDNVQFETWHHYVYSGNSTLPVTDSVYTFGIVGSGPLPETVFYGRKYVNFTYDSYGRIVKAVEVQIQPIPGTTESIYTYNAAGNLTTIAAMSPDGTNTTNYISYDNKINMHQTNAIWQLIDRDYSVNNPFTAVSYNSSGLPTIIGGESSSGRFLDYNFTGQLEIFYDCRGVGHW